MYVCVYSEQMAKIKAYRCLYISCKAIEIIE